jgi:hypothetical protein
MQLNYSENGQYKAKSRKQVKALGSGAKESFELSGYVSENKKYTRSTRQ